MHGLRPLLEREGGGPQRIEFRAAEVGRRPTRPPGVCSTGSRALSRRFILEGVYEIQADDERLTAEADSMVVIPRNVPHRFRNAGDVVARALMIFRPGGFDELIAEMRHAAVAGTVDEERRHAILAKSQWGAVGRA